MSKKINPIWPVSAVTWLILQFFTFASGQNIEASIKIDAKTSSTVTVKGRFNEPNPRKNLSFLLDFAGTRDLGLRISDLHVQNSAGEQVPVKAMIPGEYLAENEFSSWSYSVNLAPTGQASAYAHVSWLKGDEGILMLDDILPQTGKRPSPATITIDSGGRKLYTAETAEPNGVYLVRDIEKAVFVLNGSRRDYRLEEDGFPLRLTVGGDFLFTEDEASAMVESIYAEYRRVFGGSPTGTPLVTLMKFPPGIAPGNWEADTRGRSVTIMSSDMQFKSQSLQRLHEQLRHEMFHLWMPNGVGLSGNYDWFYEGFAVYQSLKIGVGTNRIRFEDMLDTLSRAYDIDRSQTQRMSMVEASRNRWEGANTQVYARGMLVAFLCDLALLNGTNRKLSSSTLLRELYEKYRGTETIKDGNDAVISLFRTHKELVPIVDRYINGSQPIDWSVLIAAAGFDSVSNGPLTKLQVVEKPSGRQKDLLDKLGYNNWRKLTSK